jgi:hypothetical protein
MGKFSVIDIFTKKRQWPWYRIDLITGVKKSNLKDAKKAASAHKDGVLPSLRYTEQNPEWALLYSHIKTGQIRPEDIRHMRRVDLEYLAGMNDSPPGLTEAESAKLRENVTRASIELHRRNEVRVGIIGAVIGVVATLLVGFLKNG